jgi:hypothetical protein
MAIRTPDDLLHDLMGCRGDGRIGELFAEAVTEIMRLRRVNMDTITRLSGRMGRMSDALKGLDSAVTGLLDETPENVLKTMHPVVLRRVDQALLEARQILLNRD